jgi:hypothetical protein
LAIALVRACLGRLDMVAVAEGKVIPRGNVKVIQARTRAWSVRSTWLKDSP